MKVKFVLLIMMAFLSVPPTGAQLQQAATAKLEFEAASIRPDTSNKGVSGGCHAIDTRKGPGAESIIPLGRCVISSARLSHLIPIAYNVQLQNVKGGPDWVWGAERFNIEAKAESPSTVTSEQLSSMLQNLLTDRFQLKFHWETRQLSGHQLVIARNGPKLKEATGEGRSSIKMSGAAIFKPDAIERRNLVQNTISGEKTSMSQLADVLTNLPDGGPVIDGTGLSRLYDFKLTWEPDESLSAVLQEQLGLRLDAQKVPVEFLIIDSAEKPAEN